MGNTIHGPTGGRGDPPYINGWGDSSVIIGSRDDGELPLMNKSGGDHPNHVEARGDPAKGMKRVGPWREMNNRGKCSNWKGLKTTSITIWKRQDGRGLPGW